MSVLRTNGPLVYSAIDACSHTGLMIATTNICLFVYLLDLLVKVSFKHHGHVRTLLPYHGTSLTHDLMCLSRLTGAKFWRSGLSIIHMFCNWQSNQMTVLVIIDCKYYKMINPYLTNGYSHHYHLDESILFFYLTFR